MLCLMNLPSPTDSSGARPASPPQKRRVIFMANGIYTDQISGGDIHFFYLAQAAMDAGYTVHFFGGHALEKQLRARFKDFELTLTDTSLAKPLNANSVSGQVRLLVDYLRRFVGSVRRLSKIQPEDVAYAVSDYWFDVLPVVLSNAGRKLMIWHMQAASLLQIILKTRADVDSVRVASFYYWLSQNSSLLLFRYCLNKRLLFVHPTMQEWLLRWGYRENEIKYISFGVDVEKAEATQEQQKRYDVVWIGRVHRQKGIEDLLSTLSYLAKRIENFRAVLIGNLKGELGPEIERHGLSQYVEFSGFVSEEEKFRLFHQSRVFLMTSKFEGSPRVVAEAIVCNVPVVAYDVKTYRPIFGDFVRYVPCFDVEAYQAEAERVITGMRAGRNPLSQLNLRDFNDIHSWGQTNEVFLNLLRD